MIDEHVASLLSDNYRASNEWHERRVGSDLGAYLDGERQWIVTKIRALQCLGRKRLANRTPEERASFPTYWSEYLRETEAAMLAQRPSWVRDLIGVGALGGGVGLSVSQGTGEAHALTEHPDQGTVIPAQSA